MAGGDRVRRGAVIGCGYFARNHLHAWAGLPGVRIAAVCDRDQGRAETAAAIVGGAAVHTDADAMLAAEDLDFVDIVTTVEDHRSLVELAAARGVGAICQKPFAATFEDAEAMVAACAAAGVPLMVHENFRWQAPLRAVAAAIGQGAIGRPNYARLSFRHGFDIYADQPYLRTEPRLAILDLGIHLLDVARALLGEATRLHCRTQRIDPCVAGEDAATIALDHRDGAVSLVDFCFSTKVVPDPFPQTIVRVEGDRGTVELFPGHRLRISGDGRMEERDVTPPVPPWGTPGRHLIQDSVIEIQRHWLDALAGGRPLATSGADNLRTLDLVFAAYDSAESGRAVAVGGRA